MSMASSPSSPRSCSSPTSPRPLFAPSLQATVGSNVELGRRQSPPRTRPLSPRQGVSSGIAATPQTASSLFPGVVSVVRQPAADQAGRRSPSPIGGIVQPGPTPIQPAPLTAPLRTQTLVYSGINIDPLADFSGLDTVASGPLSPLPSVSSAASAGRPTGAASTPPADDTLGLPLVPLSVPVTFPRLIFSQSISRRLPS